MNKKDKMNLLLSKVEEDKKDAFIVELRGSKTKEERAEVIKKYGAVPTQEEIASLKGEAGNEVSDEELDQAVGGCSCFCTCSSDCGCT